MSKFMDALKGKQAKIRFLSRKDMEEVLNIELDCYPSNPWTKNDFHLVLRQPISQAFVAIYKTDIVGFLVYEMQPGKLEILNMCVPPEIQRCGVGTALMDRLKIGLGLKERSRIVVLVRETNLDGQLFLNMQGFIATAILEDYYKLDNGGDHPKGSGLTPDAYLFEYNLRDCRKTKAATD